MNEINVILIIFLLMLLVINIIYAKNNVNELTKAKDLYKKTESLSEETDKICKEIENNIQEMKELVLANNISMIVCTTEDFLLGSAKPKSGTNGLLWNVPEELKFFKKMTMNSVIVLGKNTAKFVPIDKIREQGRLVEIVSEENTMMDIFVRYPHKEIMICGGAYLYKYALENLPLKNIYMSVLKPHVKIKKTKVPLYLENPNICGYVTSEKWDEEYDDFIVKTYVPEYKLIDLIIKNLGEGEKDNGRQKCK